MTVGKRSSAGWTQGVLDRAEPVKSVARVPWQAKLRERRRHGKCRTAKWWQHEDVWIRRAWARHRRRWQRAYLRGRWDVEDVWDVDISDPRHTSGLLTW